MILHLAKFHEYVHDLPLPHANGCGIADYYGRENGYAFLGIPYQVIEVECDDRRPCVEEAEQNFWTRWIYTDIIHMNTTVKAEKIRI